MTSELQPKTPPTTVQPTGVDDPNGLRGRRVLLLGLGSREGGVGVARYLVTQGAEVCVTDMRSAEQLAGPLADLDGLPLHLHLGGHTTDDVDWADLIVRNPAVPADAPLLQYAALHGVPVEMEMTFFLRACVGPVVGITGTKGKTSTTTLLWEMLRAWRADAVLAGNMGRSALTQLPAITPQTPVALELSSFQLEALDAHHLAPHVAVITNVSPDHLDRYPDHAAYFATKAALARWQQPGDWLIVPADDPTLHGALGQTAAQRVLVGAVDPALLESDATFGAISVQDGCVVAHWGASTIDLGSVDNLPGSGEHVRQNALMAIAAALALGAPLDAIEAGLRNYRGVPHRFELVATVDGVAYINDSAATAPAAAVAAMRALAALRPVVIAGGSDKRLPLDPFADALAEHASAIVLLEGTATPALQALLGTRRVANVHGPVGSMAAAVDLAASLVQSGSAVVLSPGTASFGMFRDEFDRGDQFRALALARATAHDEVTS